jgi:hypothetical protein
VPVLAPEGVSGKELIAIVEAGGRTPAAMVNFTFHGVGGDYLQSRMRHRALRLPRRAPRSILVGTDLMLAERTLKRGGIR